MSGTIKTKLIVIPTRGLLKIRKTENQLLRFMV